MRLRALMLALTASACAPGAAGPDALAVRHSPAPPQPPAPVIDVAAGPGEPGAVDVVCEVEQSTEGAFADVEVSCATFDPGADVVRESLVRGLGLNLLAGGQVAADWIPPSGRTYQFVVDDGRRPLRPPPLFPEAARRVEATATCDARFDLTPEGATTSVAVECWTSEKFRPAFEDATREAVSRWLFPPATGAPGEDARTGLRTRLEFAYP